MKRTIFSLAIWVTIMGSVYLAQAQSSFPAFSFKNLKGEVFTQANLDPEKPAMIMMFDPYCDHCDQQAEWIAEAADQFQETQFVFVTIEPEKHPIEDFRKRHFGEVNLPHLYFLQDLDFMFEGYFGYTDDAVNIYLFSPNRRQPKYFGKEQPVEVLKKHL